MPKNIESVEATAFFGTQMVIHLVRSFVYNGLVPEAGIRTNIQETIDQGTVTFGEKHHRHLVAIAQAFEEAVREGLSLKAKKEGRSG